MVEYCKVSLIKCISQVQKEQLEFSTEDDYNTFLGMLLTIARKVMNKYVGHDFQYNAAQAVTLEQRIAGVIAAKLLTL